MQTQTEKQKINETSAPDWSKAPTWAQWWAMDLNGRGFWYENKPETTENGRDSYWWESNGSVESDGIQEKREDWRETLTERPEAEKIKSEVPDWSKAPDWAQWWAMDLNGRAYWYKHEPEKDMDGRWRASAGNMIHDDLSSQADICLEWAETLVERPKAKQAKIPAPDWSKAPDWAQWWAVDSTGYAYYYQACPQRGDAVWIAWEGTVTMTGKIDLDGYDWKESIASRPKPPSVDDDEERAKSKRKLATLASSMREVVSILESLIHLIEKE